MASVWQNGVLLRSFEYAAPLLSMVSITFYCSVENVDVIAVSKFHRRIKAFASAFTTVMRLIIVTFGSLSLFWNRTRFRVGKSRDFQQGDLLQICIQAFWSKAVESNPRQLKEREWWIFAFSVISKPVSISGDPHGDLLTCRSKFEPNFFDFFWIFHTFKKRLLLLPPPTHPVAATCVNYRCFTSDKCGSSLLVTCSET